MDPILMAMMGAANDPGKWGPILDALGPQFGPEMLLPMLQQVSMGGQPGMFAPMAPEAQAQPPMQPQAPPQPQAPGMVPPASNPVAGPASPAAAALATQPQQPVVQRPQAPQPIMSGGVAGAQKAGPDAGGLSLANDPLQMLMALAVQGQQGKANPLRVPTLGQMFGGAY